MTELTLDHLVVCTTRLATGAAEVGYALGADLAAGGQHAAMGTHNRLLSLGPEAYLEVIAADPDADPPGVPRWFGLDGFEGPTRLCHWACRTPDLDASLARAPQGAGRPWDLARGDLRWRMGVTDTGALPWGGLWPALLQWQVPPPAPRLPDAGLRLCQLVLTHPDATGLEAVLRPMIADERVTVEPGAKAGLRAQIAKPDGATTWL